MIYRVLIFSLWILGTMSCKKSPPDGNYCAKVFYQNNDNKKQSFYTVIVEVNKNQLIDISFPETHYDQSEIKPVTIPDNGKVTAVSSSGQIYKVEMQGPAEKCINATNLTQCIGKSKDGKRCKRLTSKKNGLCWQHDKK